MNQYNPEEIYFSIESLFKYCRAYNYVIGGRGTGKTYGSLKAMIEGGYKFVFMRRTQTQLEQVMSQKEIKIDDETSIRADLSPFKKLEIDMGWTCKIERITRDSYAIIMNGKHVGYGVALNTIANIRGFDATDCHYLIYDEFIPEHHARPIKDEGDAFLNAYDTINRNRELEGKEPLYTFLLANSNDIEAPLLHDLDISVQIEKMINRGKSFMDFQDRGYTVSLLKNKKFEEARKNTVLYKFTRGLRYSKMAFENKFAYDDFSNIRSYDIRQFSPYLSIGEYYIYRNKGEGWIYVSHCRAKVKESYPYTEYGFQQFKRNHGREFYQEYMDGTMKFETYRCKKLLTNIVA